MNERFTNQGPYSASEMKTPDVMDGRETISSLIRGLAGDLSTLFSKELSLAKAELREAASEVKTAIASMATGAVLAMAGVVVLLLSAVFGLDKVVELWLEALIVGLAALLLGFALIKAAKNKMEPSAFTPERTVESLHKNKQTAERAIK